MHIEKITYTDYNGMERTEEFMFNMNLAEITEMQLGVDGGLSEKLRKIESRGNIPEAIKFFKSFILKAYGEKSSDGRRFIKSEELSTEFSQTEAYVELFTRLGNDPKAAAEFVKKVVPKDLSEKVEELTRKQPELLGE